jgi:hypothetical protein
LACSGKELLSFDKGHRPAMVPGQASEEGAPAIRTQLVCRFGRRKRLKSGPWNKFNHKRIIERDLRRNRRKGAVMQFGYAQPFSFKVERSDAKNNPKPKPVVASIRHGVTEITLEDGKVVRATLHVKSVAVNPNKPGSVDVNYSVVTEVVAIPNALILDQHETLQ